MSEQLRFMENETVQEADYVANLRKVQAIEQELRHERDQRTRETDEAATEHLVESNNWASKATVQVELEDKEIDKRAQELHVK